MASPTDSPDVTDRHPLDPLTAGEIRHAAAALLEQKRVNHRWRFASIELAEPSKDELAAGPDGISRTAHVVCWNTADGQAYRAMVALPGGEIIHWQHLAGEQPNMTVDEWHECDEMLRHHPAVIEALASRGITDMSLVLTDVWAYGAALVPERYRGLRLGWADVWARGRPEGNPYAHHITGLHPVVDLNRMELLELEDSREAGGAAERPEVMGEYLPELIPMPLREISPLAVTQPEGWLASMFAQATLWGASLPGHQHMTLGVIMADYLREKQHQSPAQVQADMRAVAQFSPLRGLFLCTLDSPQGFQSFRAARLAAIRSGRGNRHPAVNPACWQ